MFVVSRCFVCYSFAKNPRSNVFPTFTDVAEVPWGRVKFQLWQLHRCRSCRSEDRLDPLQGTSPKVLGILLWKCHLCISDVKKKWRATVPQTAGDVWVSNFLRAGNNNFNQFHTFERSGKTRTLDIIGLYIFIHDVFPTFSHYTGKWRQSWGLAAWDLCFSQGSWRRSHTAWPGGPSAVCLPKHFGMSSKKPWVSMGYICYNILYNIIYITFKRIGYIYGCISTVR